MAISRLHLILAVTAAASCGKVRSDSLVARSFDALTPNVTSASQLDRISTSPDGPSGAGDTSIAVGDGQYLAAIERGFCFSVVRVTAAGQPVEPGGLCVGPPASTGRKSKISWDGQHWLVVWQDSGLHAVRVTGDGEVLDNPPLSLASNADYEAGPGVANNGERFLIVWGSPTTATETATIRGVWMLADAGRSAPFVVAAGGRYPAIASDGEDFLVSWRDCCGSPTPSAFAARVTSDGGIFPIGPLSGGSADRQASIAWTGSEYVVAIAEGASSVLARRVASSGTFVDPGPISLGALGWEPQVAADGFGATIVASSHDGTGAGTYSAVQLRPDGTVAGRRTLYQTVYGWGASIAAAQGQAMLVVKDEFLHNGSYQGPVNMALPIATSPPFDAGVAVVIQERANSETEPTVAVSSERALLVWVDTRGPRTSEDYELTRIWAKFADRKTLAVDPDSFPLSTTTTFFPYPAVSSRPRVRSDGIDFLAVWQQGLNVRVGRVLRDGGTPDFPGVPIGVGRVGDVVFSAGKYFVLWSDSAGRVLSTAVSASGTLGPTRELSALPGQVTWLRADDERGDVLVTWAQGNPGVVRGARFNPHNQAPRGTFSFPPGGISQALPALASDGDRPLLVWTETSGGMSWLVGALGDGDGGWSPATGAFTATSLDAGQDLPQVAFDGANYIVTWVETAAGRRELLAARFSPSAGALDAAPIFLPTDGGVGSHAIARASHGRTLVVTSERDSRLRIDRLFGRIVSSSTCLADGGCDEAGACQAGGSCDGPSGGCFWSDVAERSPCGDAGLCTLGLCRWVATVPDGGGVDAGQVDGGGSAGDGGSLIGDAGMDTADAAEPDAGVADSGNSEGGDVAQGNGGSSQVGCGCRAGSERGLAMLLLLLIRRRSRGGNRSEGSAAKPMTAEGPWKQHGFRVTQNPCQISRSPSTRKF